MSMDYTFTQVADALLRSGESDKVVQHVLFALVDKIGVPVMSAETYRDKPAVRAVFEARGITYLPLNNDAAEHLQRLDVESRPPRPVSSYPATVLRQKEES